MPKWNLTYLSRGQVVLFSRESLLSWRLHFVFIVWLYFCLCLLARIGSYLRIGKRKKLSFRPFQFCLSPAPWNYCKMFWILFEWTWGGIRPLISGTSLPVTPLVQKQKVQGKSALPLLCHKSCVEFVIWSFIDRLKKSARPHQIISPLPFFMLAAGSTQEVNGPDWQAGGNFSRSPV